MIHAAQIGASGTRIVVTQPRHRHSVAAREE